MTTLSSYRVLSRESLNTGRLLHAEKDGVRYILKEYGAKRYPNESEKDYPHYEPLRQSADRFLGFLKRIQDEIGVRFRREGLLNAPVDVFRDGVSVYKATRYVQSCGIPHKDVHLSLRPAQIDTLLRTALLQLDMLAQIGLIHCDIKPDNVIVHQRGEVYVGSLIDYEGGFFIDDLYQTMGIVHTPEYAAPEMVSYQHEIGDDADERVMVEAAKLTPALDVFAFGCVYAFWLTGDLLCHTLEPARFLSPGALLLGGVPLAMPRVNGVRRALIQRMTRAVARKRPSAAQCVRMLNAAQTSGLLRAMEHPFDALAGAYDLRADAAPFSCERQSRIVSIDKKKHAAWHIPQDFLPEGLDGWEEQAADARRRRVRRERALSKTARCGQWDRGLLPCVTVYEGALAFAICPVPFRRNMPFVAAEALCNLFDDTEECDGLMCRLLAMTHALHAHGLFHGALDKRSFWFALREGEIVPYFHETWRLSARDTPPEPEDFDVPPDALAPEVGAYMASGLSASESPLAPSIGAAADVYALGLLYHILLCGELPALGEDVNGNEFPALYSALRAGQPTLRLSNAIDARRAAIIRGMTAYRPSARCASCEQAIAMIRALFARDAPQREESADVTAPDTTTPTEGED